MKFNSVFDIIGPTMVGPSSSHTAGAARIGLVARYLLNEEPTWANIYLYESFAKTYKGHGTDFAIVGGLLGFDTNDEKLRTSLKIAEDKNIDVQFFEEQTSVDHPNTARIKTGTKNTEIEVVGKSIGGGKIEIIELNGFELRLSGNHPALLIMHNDRRGAIASVTKMLAKSELNIGHMEVNRKDIGKEALMVIEIDGNVDQNLLNQLSKADHVIQVAKIDG